MPYPKQEDYIKFLLQLLEKFEAKEEKQKGPGRPPVYKNRVLICFFAIMQLKRCFAFKAMHRWLLNHPKEAKQPCLSPACRRQGRQVGFPKISSRKTLSRRYKALYEIIQEPEGLLPIACLPQAGQTGVPKRDFLFLLK